MLVTPINIVKIGDKINPPFLNASPMAKIPQPMFPFNMFINVSRYLKKEKVCVIV